MQKKKQIKQFARDHHFLEKSQKKNTLSLWRLGSLADLAAKRSEAQRIMPKITEPQERERRKKRRERETKYMFVCMFYLSPLPDNCFHLGNSPKNYETKLR